MCNTIFMWQKEYNITKSNTSIDEIALELFQLLMEDLMQDDEKRSFKTTEYNDLSISFEDHTDNNYEDNSYYVTGEVKIKFTGLFSPIGIGEDLPEELYSEVSLGERLIIQKGDSYTLRSLYVPWT